MTPYQFGIKMAVKTAAAPQAMNMNAQPKPLTSGQRVENYMRNINEPAQPRPPRVALPKPQTPVLPNLNPSMLMGNNQPQYSPSPEYNQSSNFMGVASAPIDDIDVGPLDVPSKPVPSALASMPSTKQLMSKVQVPPRSPFNLAKTTPAPVQQPAPTDVAKF